MKVMIAKANEAFIKEHCPKVEFVSASTNTSIFNIKPTAFEKLKAKVRELGYNPFALFHW